MAQNFRDFDDFQGSWVPARFQNLSCAGTWTRLSDEAIRSAHPLVHVRDKAKDCHVDALRPGVRGELLAQLGVRAADHDDLRFACRRHSIRTFANRESNLHINFAAL